MHPATRACTLVVNSPQTRYALSGDLNIPFQVVGEGPIDLVFVAGSWSDIELVWQVQGWAAFFPTSRFVLAPDSFTSRLCPRAPRPALWPVKGGASE